MSQDVISNRQKVVNMLLSQSHLKVNNNRENHLAGIYILSSGPQPTPSCFRQVSTIPKYCLDKGAVICRLEEYVQLHSPIKLNIGLGGE